MNVDDVRGSFLKEKFPKIEKALNETCEELIQREDIAGEIGWLIEYLCSSAGSLEEEFFPEEEFDDEELEDEDYESIYYVPTGAKV